MRNDALIGDKAVNAVRRLEGDAQALFCHDGVKVASNWTPYLADARVPAPFAPKELPNSITQSPPAKQIVALKQTLYQLLDFWNQNTHCNAAKRVEEPWMR